MRIAKTRSVSSKGTISIEKPIAAADSIGITIAGSLATFINLITSIELINPIIKRSGITHKYFGRMMIKNKKGDKAPAKRISQQGICLVADHNKNKCQRSAWSKYPGWRPGHQYHQSG